ncbi:MAG: fatty acid desaturase [Wenzhouxiangellaceae bacterium]
MIWSVAGFFILSNLAALTIVPWYGLTYGFSATAWWSFFVFLMLNGLSITGGYHRLWSHRSYSARRPLRIFYALFGAQALQNSILIWVARHRVHHRYVDDNERDPYSAKLGLWFSHMGWMVRDWPSSEVNYEVVRDLQQDPLVMWQHRHYWALTWFMNLGLPLLAGWLLGDLWGVFLLGGLLRLVVNHHLTFFINSLAHYVGRQTYSRECTARDSHVLGLITWGEGYHNFHHTFQNDYRNGIRWWHLDMGKWFIGLNVLLGQAYNLRRVPAFKIQRARLQLLFAQARERLAADQNEAGANADERPWREIVEQEYNAFMETVRRWQSLQSERFQTGSQALKDRWDRTSLASRLRELEYSLYQQQRRMRVLLRAAASEPVAG